MGMKPESQIRGRLSKEESWKSAGAEKKGGAMQAIYAKADGIFISPTCIRIFENRHLGDFFDFCIFFHLGLFFISPGILYKFVKQWYEKFSVGVSIIIIII